jgi:hypothetical protein
MIDVRAPIDIRVYGNPLRRTRLSGTGSDVPTVDSSAIARLAVSGLSTLALVAWGMGEATGIAELRISGGLWYCLVGVGSAPWSLVRWLPAVTRVVLTGLTTLSVLTMGSTMMLVVGVWWPRPTLLVLILVTLPAHLWCCRSTAPEIATGRMPTLDLGSPREFLALGLAASGSLLCLGSALTHRHIDPGFWGFLPEIGVFWFLGLGQLLVSVVISRTSRRAIMAICVVALMFATVVTPALVYDGPRSQSAAKHVDLIEQIRTFHELASSIRVYNAWPGFFGAIAWMCDSCGIQDPMVLATAWPVVIGGLRLAALRFLAGAVIGSPRLAWTATAIALLADPIGADYFSPQSIGFVVALVAFGFALGGERPGVMPRWCSVLALALSGCTLAISHQLSPYLVGGVLILLVAFRQVRPWWIPLLVITPTVGWAVTHWDSVQGFVAISDIGRFYNFRPPPRPTADGLSRLPVVAQTSGALVLGIVTTGVLALAVLLRERRDLRTWAIAACPAVGLAFVVVNPYGNEGIFRASLFGIPWLATLAARAFDGLSVRTSDISFGLIGCGLTMTFLTAAFGLDGTNVMRQSDREIFDYLRDRTTGVENHTVLLDLGIGDLPMSPPGPWGRYLAIQRGELGEPIHKSGDQPADILVAHLTRRLITYTGEEAGKTTLYALWSPVSMRYGWAYGIVRPQNFSELRDAFQRCDYWTLARGEGGTLLFRFDASRYARTLG